MTTRSKDKQPAAMSIAELRRVAGDLVTIDDTDESYTATAARGYCFDEDLHELVACHWDGNSSTPESRREARWDLYKRLTEYRRINAGSVVELCTNKNCDWCRGGDGSP